MNNKFYNSISYNVLQNINRLHGKENWDFERYGKRNKKAFIDDIFILLNKVLERLNYRIVPIDNISDKYEKILNEYGEKLSEVYELLFDSYSKNVFVDVLTYRILGPRRKRLFKNSDEYWVMRKRAKSLSILTKKGYRFDNKYNLYDLKPIGYPLLVISNPLIITHQFIKTHYVYLQKKPPIQVKPGDYVIDGGGAFGDTALRFANDVGETGKVLSFEFEKNNLKVFRENLELNQKNSSRIEIIEKALWIDSASTLYYKSNGPGTRVKENVGSEAGNAVQTISIDDVIDDIKKIDFIKMDIEGAELQALKGAEKSIRTYRPTLAISIYHSLEDFFQIPLYLKSIEPGYSFYLDHGTIHKEETVLFAIFE